MAASHPNLKGLKLYVRYWRIFWQRASLSFLFSLCVALQLTIIPLLIAAVLGELIHSHTVNTGLLIFTGAFYLGLTGLCYLLDVYGIARLHHSVEKRLYADSFKYLIHQDYSFFANRFSGSIVTQASRFAKIYTVFNDTVFFDMVPQLLAVLIAIGIMTYYSPLIGLIVLVSWLILIFVVIKFALGRLPLRRGAVAKESEQIGELADAITNATTVKTFAAEDREIKRYDAINQIRGQLFLNSWSRAIRNGWIIETFCVALQMIVLVGAVLAVKDGALSIATFLLFQVYILRIIESIKRSSFIVRQLEAAAGDSQEMAELMEQAPLIQDAADAKTVHIRKGAVSFENMAFHYNDATNREALFDSFNLTVQPGEKIGLVGPSGGGKTTITRLLLRFMDIQDGAILIDGHDIRAITQKSLRQAIAYVPQEPMLFHRSIKDNIRYGRPDASDKDVMEAAKKSYAHDFITALPQGYDTLVGERGVKLSGGQRQRIAIARAMLADAPILVLDEATSALDSESEVLIQKALRELMKHKTAVVIAHRLSTIQRMDRIVVLSDGRISEEGSHKQLLEQDGIYARLWSHQSGGFIEE